MSIPPEAASLADRVLAGGGQMGALMRATDWTTTPVGPIESWPQSLRTALSIVLDSRYPMYVAWGPEFVQFYNDAYRPILGSTKHPAALGQSTRECFREIWDFIGPMFERVLERGEATYLEDQLLPLDRNGYVEECYFTFCYSAIRHESGGPGGVFVTVIETTERVFGERRLRTLRDLGAAALEAETAESACASAADILATNPCDIPFSLLYLLDEEGRTARLVGHAGIEPGGTAIPPSFDVRPTGEVEPSPLAAVASGASSHEVVGLAAHFGALRCGPWPEQPEHALLLPIARPGQERPTGVLVAGISGRRRLDDEYESFLKLVAGHVATAVSNARALQEERRRAQALAELDRAKTAFFSNVSHEFRTPLSLMLGPLDELLHADLPEHARGSVTVAQRNALRLLRLVNTLLDFSRIEAGRVQASYEPTDLPALTADLASAFRSAIERAGLRLTVDAPPLSEPVYVDRDMWEKVVLNLVSNALKHTFEGDIEVAVRARGALVELVVRDTGVGIPEPELPRLFDRFHRVRGARSRTHEGSGIGLALVSELVRLHGGEIRVESRVDEGTTFTVSLPLGTDHLPPDRIESARDLSSTAIGATPFVEEALRWLPGGSDAEVRGALEATGAEGSTLSGSAPAGSERGRVVVIDDNADMRDYLVRLLERHWQVAAFADGRAALESVRRSPPELVLSDIMMPELDGFELLRELREEPRTAEVPVVLVSARAGEESRVEALQAGADDFIVKPFSARELLARVHSTLELARTRRDAATERERLIRALTAERARLAEIIDRSPAFIAVLRGADHVFERANEPYLRLVGGRDLIGRPIREALPEIDRQGYVELLDGVFRTGEPFVGKEHRVLLHREQDGPPAEVILDFVYQALYDDEGGAAGVFVHGVDVTDLVRARRAAEAANQAKSDFMATISHELRTPLNAILGYVDLLSMGVPEAIPDRSLEQVARVGASARHLLQIIDELLTYTSLQAGKENLMAMRIDLDALVDEIRAIIEPLAARKSLEFRVSMSPPPTEVVTDARKLRQILLNLLGNAVKFTGRGQVTLSIRGSEEGIGFEVRDSGPGMSEEELARIFEPFWQGDAVRRRLSGGTGLGLAISQRLARVIGGEIVVESQVGAGSCFRLHLPTRIETAASTLAQGSEAPRPNGGSELREWQ